MVMDPSPRPLAPPFRCHCLPGWQLEYVPPPSFSHIDTNKAHIFIRLTALAKAHSKPWKTNNLIDKVHDIETRDCTPSHPSTAQLRDSDSSLNKKGMQLGTKKRQGRKKPKSLKSKEGQVGPDISKKSRRVSQKRTTYSDIYDDIEAKFSVMERAERVLASSASDTPNFLKCMLPSNVAHGFWLHLPRRFCKLHFPNHDTTITLVDEWGNEYKTSYLLGRHGLSAGWRGFAIAHRLLKGDILIFLLIEPCKLKVHIVRVNGLDVVGAALCLVNLDASWREMESDPVKKDNRKRRKTKYVDPFLLNNSMPWEVDGTDEKSTLRCGIRPKECQFESSSDCCLQTY